MTGAQEWAILDPGVFEGGKWHGDNIEERGH